MKRSYSGVIVGVGSAGIGMGTTLWDLGLEDFVLLERSPTSDWLAARTALTGERLELKGEALS